MRSTVRGENRIRSSRKSDQEGKKKEERRDNRIYRHFSSLSHVKSVRIHLFSKALMSRHFSFILILLLIRRKEMREAKTNIQSIGSEIFKSSYWTKLDFVFFRKTDKKKRRVVECFLMKKNLFVLTSFQIKLIKELQRSIFIINMSTSIHHWFVLKKKKKKNFRRLSFFRPTFDEKKKKKIFSRFCFVLHHWFNQDLDRDEVKVLLFLLSQVHILKRNFSGWRLKIMRKKC